MVVTVSVAVAFTAGGLAAPGQSGANAGDGGAPVDIPDDAKEVAPGVYYLGERQHQGRTVEGYAFVRFRKGYHHRPGHGGGPPGDDGGSGDASHCYDFFDRHTRWRTAEDYVVNPSNDEADLTEDFVLSNLGTDVGKWEGAAGTNIVGAQHSTSDQLSADTDSPDDLNEVYFGDIEESGAIGVTIVWGVFSGPPSNRRLVEWDQVYDQADFDWSDSGDAGRMDFENVATHELGHTIGLGHPSDTCTEETMYAFAELGETKKRTLHDGDIAGAAELY